jgi:hypothetical protein
MNKPPRSLLALLLIAPLLAGGCTLYANPSACKAQMRQAAANATPPRTLSISDVDVGIDGSRVVVEGTLKTAAAAADQSDASASIPAKAPAAKPTAKQVGKPAAAECTFDGNKLKALRWLSPPELANAPSTPSTKE